MAGWRIGAGAEYGEELERNGEDIELGCAAVHKFVPIGAIMEAWAWAVFGSPVGYSF